MTDYIIVGGGSAGCVLASRLSEDPRAHVLLIEAGGTDTKREIRIPLAWLKLFKSELDWNYTTTPQVGLGGRRVYWPRGKTLGGCSSCNAMMAIPGHRADYDGWADLGNEGWSFDELAPQLERAAPRGHTNLPTMLIAEKAAQLIAGTRSTRQSTAANELPLAATSARP